MIRAQERSLSLLYMMTPGLWLVINTGGYEDDGCELSVALSGDGTWTSVGSPRAGNESGSGIMRLYGVH